MGKKRNKKHNKFRRIQPKNPAPAAILQDTSIASSPQPEQTENTENVIILEKPISIDKYGYVRKDIKKILIIMTILVLLLIVSLFVELKTDLFKDFGNWIYKVLNIQTL